METITTYFNDDGKIVGKKSDATRFEEVTYDENDLIYKTIMGKLPSKNQNNNKESLKQDAAYQDFKTPSKLDKEVEDILASIQDDVMASIKKTTYFSSKPTTQE